MVCGFIGGGIIDDREYGYLLDKTIEIAERLVTEEDATMFLIGTRGRFSRLAVTAASAMLHRHPGTNYYKVLPFWSDYFSNRAHTYTPEEVLNARPYEGLAASYRWIADNSDIIIYCPGRGWDGTVAYARLAAEQGKPVINLGSIN